MTTGPGGCQCATDLGLNPQATLQGNLDAEEEERKKKLLAAQKEKDQTTATYALFSNSYGADGGTGTSSGPGDAGGGAAAP